MSENTSPPSLEDENSLAHYGVKGMRWGHRKSEDEGSSSSGGGQSSGQKSGLSDGQKKALKYAAGGALVAGALIGTAVLAKNGKLPVKSLSGINPNSLAAETKRMEKIPGTIAYKNKMAKNPSSLAAETARMAKIPGTIANREAQLAKASAHARTLKPEHQAEFMRRVTEKIEGEARHRAAVQTNLARRLAEKAQEDAARQAKTQAALAKRLAETKSGDSAEPSSPLDKISSAKDMLEAFTQGKELVDVIRNSEAWNRPASELQSNLTPEQRAAMEAQNGGNSGRRNR